MESANFILIKEVSDLINNKNYDSILFFKFRDFISVHAFSFKTDTLRNIAFSTHENFGLIYS